MLLFDMSLNGLCPARSKFCSKTPPLHSECLQILALSSSETGRPNGSQAQNLEPIWTRRSISHCLRRVLIALAVKAIINSTQGIPLAPGLLAIVSCSTANMHGAGSKLQCWPQFNSCWYRSNSVQVLQCCESRIHIFLKELLCLFVFYGCPLASNMLHVLNNREHLLGHSTENCSLRP